MFALEEIKFDLKPYFKVELQALNAGAAPEQDAQITPAEALPADPVAEPEMEAAPATSSTGARSRCTSAPRRACPDGRSGTGTDGRTPLQLRRSGHSPTPSLPLHLLLRLRPHLSPSPHRAPEQPGAPRLVRALRDTCGSLVPYCRGRGPTRR